MAVGTMKVYDEAIEAAFGGTLGNIGSGTIFAALLASTYTPDLAVDDTWSDVSSHQVTGGDYARQALANKALTDVTGGVRFTSDAISWGTNVTIPASKYCVLVIGNPASPQASDKLLAVCDLNDTNGSATVSATNGAFSLTPNANGWFEVKRTA